MKNKRNPNTGNVSLLTESNLTTPHLTVAQFCARERIVPLTFRRWVREGRIHPLKLARRVVIPVEEVLRFEEDARV